MRCPRSAVRPGAQGGPETLGDTPSRAPRLKSLELQGYKTFASRTLFEFAPNITAVVGPNGSGKSNIADALRWVLGEQTYSLLRGKKTEDMIFSGSETRPRVSMASATITFDNSEAWLPIEFADVVIGRRAYRDGENEYSLNNQKVRLRDVSELLSECGLGQRTHTIIGQGLVDAILSLKPEERRRLVEEAAGIGLYRERREESLRRLEATRRNIERAKDILAELRPRLNQLERQARRARDYQQVRDDLLEALRTWYGHHWYRQQDAVLHARDRASRQDHFGDDLRQRQEAAERELSAIREHVNAERRRWQALSSETMALRTERENPARRVAVAEERMRWLREQESLLQGELVSNEADLAALQERRTQLRAELEERTRELDSLSAAAAGIETGSRRVEQLQRKTQELVTRRDNHGAKRAERIALRTHLEERVRSLDSKRQGRLQEAGERAQALEEARSRRREAELAWDRAGQQVRSLDLRLEELRRELESQEGKHSSMVAEQTRARAELTKISAALEGLRMSAASGRQPLARLVQEHGEGGQLPGWIGRLAAHIRVRAEHRLAIVAALGAFAEGLVFRSEEDLRRALAWLETQEGWGDVGLVALGSISAAARVTVPTDSSSIGLGSDLVECSPAYRIVVDRLLSHTLVVHDREGADRLAPWLPAGAQIVTLAGEVFLSTGAVIGRREPGAAPDPSFEARLEAARANQWKKVEQWDREISAGAKQLEDTRRGLSEVEGALSLAKDGEVEARLSRERITLTLDAAEERHARVLQEIRSLDEERAGLAAQQAELEAGELLSNQEQMHWEAELSAARALLGGEAPGLGGEEPALERLRRQVDENRRRDDEVQAQESRLTESARQRRERLELTLATLRETQEERELHQGSLLEVEGRLASLDADLRSSGEQLEQLEATRSGLEADAVRARTELQAAERASSHAQIELAKREQELAGLSRRIQDDFGLVAFDFDESQTVQVPLPIEGLAERLERVKELPLEVESQVERLRAQLRRTGPISPEVQLEYEETVQRFEFLTQQLSDLDEAESQIHQVVAELDDLMEREFARTFEAVSVGFKQSFVRLFGGGSARLSLLPSEDGTASGIEIEARLPGRREQGLSMLSGGERSLTACALIFAMLNASPTPFCVLDEVDAMLDDANVARFCEMLRELGRETQVVVITHNRQTIQFADVIYGVSMGSDSASRIVSLKLNEAEKQLSR